MAAALESFERYQRESCRCAEIKPDNAAVLRDLAVSHYKLAEWEKARANDSSLLLEERRDCWRRASHSLNECRVVFIDMKNRGLLDKSDLGVTETLAREISTCGNERDCLEPNKPLN
ncbi:MAG: hypothetical protein ACE5EQ_07740 [Phycisphaerae bacterium]